MKKLFSHPWVILILGAVTAGFLLILLVQINQPLGGSASVSDVTLRAQSNDIILVIGIGLVIAALLLSVALFIWANVSQTQSATGGLQAITPVPSGPASPQAVQASGGTLSSVDTRSRGTRPASFPKQIPPTAAPHLAYLIGPGNQSIVIQHDDFSIGRSQSSHLVISDPRVSRQHARIVMQHGHFMLVNLSKAGTFVNSARIDEATVLKGGEQIRIGSVDFRFTLPQASNPRS